MTTPRKERETELARAAFVDAAVRVFARKGVHGATMDEIARTAGYSPGAIYRYFRAKEELFVAALQRIGEDFMAQAAEEPPVPLAFPARLRWWLVRHFEVAQKHRDFFSSVLAQRMGCELDHGELGEHAWLFYQSLLRAIQRLMEHGRREGALRPGDTFEYARAFAGLMRGLTFDWCVEPDAPPLEGRVDRIIELFLHGAGAAGGQPGATEEP